MTNHLQQELSHLALLSPDRVHLLLKSNLHAVTDLWCDPDDDDDNKDDDDDDNLDDINDQYNVDDHDDDDDYQPRSRVPVIQMVTP